MEQKKTLYDYLYQNLREQILTGILPYGAHIPSITQLCDIYNVGVRTAKDVVKALKKEGLIHTEQRRPSIVIYRHPQAATDNPVYAILGQRSSILTVYQTMSILMPLLLSFSASLCSPRKLEQCFWPLIHERREKRELWQSHSDFLHGLLAASHNLLFRDLYTSLEIYAQVPFFWEHRAEFPTTPAYEACRRKFWDIETLKTRNHEEICRHFTHSYRLSAEIISQYLDQLAREYPMVSDHSEDIYTWRAELGRDHYYMQIVRDLIDKIGLGTYKDGDYLPSEKVLADQYGASRSTIRKAIATLNQLGFGQTFTPKGTRVILATDEATYACMKTKMYKRDTLLYLSGLQFMALAAPSAAALAFPNITPSVQDRMRSRFREPGAIPLDIIMDEVISLLPLRPHRIILQEVRSILHWGYYFSFYPEGNQLSNPLNQMGLKAFEGLEAQDCGAFSMHLAQCYCHVLNVVREFMVTCGLPEAAEIVTPKKRFLQCTIYK